MKKVFGKYYLKHLEGEERKKMINSNTGVIDDIKSEAEALEFAVKLKACGGGHDNNDMSNHIYLLPNYGKDEMAIVFSGPHIMHDANTMLQSAFSASDESQSEIYPFKKQRGYGMWSRNRLGLFSRIYTWLAFFFSYVTYKLDFRKYQDKNCVKKHTIFMDGTLKSQNTLPLSVDKMKKQAK